MKRIIAFLLCFTLIFCLLSGCSKKAKPTDIKIGIAAPAVTHGWVAGVSYYAEKYCKENEVQYNFTTSENAEEMEKNLKSLADWGADAIVLWPQWSGMEKAVKSIIEQGIEVVSFDVDINTSGLYKITGNNYDMGYKSAQYIVEKVGEDASIAVLRVGSAGSVTSLRVKGFYDYLESIKYNTENIFEIEESSFASEEGYNSMQKALEEHQKIDAVFSMDDENSMGAIKAIKESGRKDIRAVTGGGGMQEYYKMILEESDSELSLSSATYSPSMVIEAIKAAVDLCSGNSVGRIVIIPTEIVDSKNAENYIDPQNTVY